MPKSRPLLLAVLVVTVAFAPVVAAASHGSGSGQDAAAYSGAHVEFETADNAVVDYRVNGETVMESVKVQSKDRAQNRGGIDVGASASSVTSIGGAGLSLASTTSVSATVSVESGAEMRAHDNARGIMVVRSGGQGQYVTANLSGDSDASQEGDRVVVTTGDGTEGTFLVVGDGTVTVNERGNVTADLGQNSRLVFRSYPDGRDSDDETQEELIANGTAAAEVYVLQAREGSEQAGETTADVVSYGQDTTVEVTEQSTGRLEMTAERSESQGKVIMCTLQREAFGAAENLQVTVDSEVAAETSSYGELQSATQNGEQSRYLVRQQSSVETSTEVLVAVNHFSQRSIAVTDGDSSGDSTEPSTPGGEDTTQPGFGVLVALAAIATALLARGRL